MRKKVIEVCPHCESENELEWDVKTMGYEAHCQVCGEHMLLCSECIDASDGLCENGSGCDWHLSDSGKSCCFRCNQDSSDAAQEDSVPIRQVIIRDLENGDELHVGFELDSGDILCGCCGGILEKGDKNVTWELVRRLNEWIDLDSYLLSHFQGSV